MHTFQIALVPEAEDVELFELLRVSAALQKPVIRDVLAAWGVNASVDAFASIDDVPVGYMPVLLTYEQARSLRALLVEDVASQDYAWVEAVDVEELPGAQPVLQVGSAEATPQPFLDNLPVSSRPPPLVTAPVRERREVVPSLAPATRKASPPGQGSRVAEAWLGAMGLVLISAVGWVLVDGRGAPAPAAASAPATTPAAPVVPATRPQQVAAPEPVLSPEPALPPEPVLSPEPSVAQHGRPERARHRVAPRAVALPAPAGTPGAPSESPAPPIEASAAAAPAPQAPPSIEASAAPAAPAPPAPPLTASFDALIESRR